MNRLSFQNELDSSGKMYRKSYIEYNYPEILEDVYEFITVNGLDLLPFKQQVYHWFNKIENYRLCYCGNSVKFKNSTIGYYEYCSKKCMDNSDKVKKRRIKTNIKKFGTKTPSENEKVKEKIIKTNNERYGGNSPLLNKEIKNKALETLNKNYRVDNPLKSELILKRVKKTLLMKYGVDNPKKCEYINNKIKNTMLDRYGVEYPLQNLTIKLKARKRQLETLAFNVKKYYKDYTIIEIDNDNRKYTMMCDKMHKFDISYVLLNSRRRSNTIICTKCNPINKSISGLEIELENFIKENYKQEILFNNRSIIEKELDIYLPDIKLAIEFNGLWWHNEINKPTNYHQEKTILCEKQGIQLIHIYEDNWIHKQNIIKSMLLNKLGKISNKIYGRKTEVREITNNKLVRIFLEENHTQGFVGSKIKLGLFYDDELVSLMTFGKKRKVLNDKSKNDDDWELSRFCNKINTVVIGGASKLFKYFINRYNPIEIVTYADKGYSKGDLYYKLGFESEYENIPGYHYIVDKIRKHRYSYRKRFLIKEGYDPNKTEHEIMLERKIYRIYDSGNLKFKWSKK